MKKSIRTPGNGVFELVEEAVHLLRCAPLNLYAAYAAGTLPFILAFLYFWADMSRGAFAREHLAAGATGMALLFVWMKCWQAVFAAALRSQITGAAAEAWTLRRAAWLAWRQIALQPSGLFAIPLALLTLLPFAWVYSFYQNLTATAGETGGLGDACKTAATQAGLRGVQNFLLLGVLLLFGFLVWINTISAMAALPALLRMLFGIDTAFTQAGWRSLFNTTYLACSFALTYAFVDPLVKAVFVLRCFYGQSVHSGNDLKAELGRLRAPTPASLAAMAGLVFFCWPVSASATQAEAVPAAARSPTNVVSPEQLDQSINQVFQQREFAWRMPREKPVESDAPQSWLARMAQSVVDLIWNGVKAAARGVKESLQWVGRQLSKLWPGTPSSQSGLSGWGSGLLYSLQILLLLVVCVLAGFLAVLIWRAYHRRRRTDIVLAEPLARRPDLTDENVAADQLPEDGWLKMAREMMEEGNLRLALRAFYLASLAHLAAREMISIAIFKSNREYETELRRRARALPEVQSAFSQNVAVFDRAWYGLHEVTQDALQQFQSNLTRIRAC